MCSKINAIFVLSATIIFSLGFLIFGCHSTQIGSLNLIEIVEEWGCYDSEIRLTCGHLDSKIAILEATFTPNCTQEECIKGDLRRLLRGHFPSRSLHSRSAAETEAGRRFLETLRNSDSNVPNAELVEAEQPHDNYPKADRLIGPKQKRNSLRMSLERLIVKYLRQISPRENFEEKRRKSERYRRELAEMLSSSDKSTDRVAIAARNITIEEHEMIQDPAETSAERYQRIYDSRSFCPEQKRKIGSLGRLEIDAAVKKDADLRQNIRKILNKRCSGKNHCSFLFAADDPIAVLWDSGLVHLKYTCMDDYHANHYCSEHLTIGNDSGPKRRQVRPEKGEPVAEARIQPRDQSFHSLKILKTTDDAEPAPTVEDENTPGEQKPERSKLRKFKNKKDQGIYSQDFKVLKILPSNLDDFNDIEELGDEIYFRTNEQQPDEIFPSVLVPTSLTLASEPAIGLNSTLASSPSTSSSRLETPEPTSGYSKNLENPKNDRFPSENYPDISKFENITLIIREGEEYFETFPKPRILDSFTVNESSTISTSFPSTSTTPTTPTTTVPNSTIPPLPQPTTTSTITTSIPTTTATIATVSTSTTEESPVAGASYVTSVERTTEPSHSGRISSHEAITNEKDIEIVPSPTSGPEQLTMEASNREHTTVVASDEFIDSSYDDDDDESFEDIYYSGRRQYTSIQRTYYGRPIPQGFTMTPGYPKFYIGDSECKWKILAPVSQKIRLTILDISLRYDPVCKDYLKIVDLVSGRSLFNSCSEPSSPIEIISSSNQVEVIVKATTKFAYPKRGVLLHYSALGCLIPPPPLHGRIVDRSETTATFECEATYVFPDTSNRRQLSCTEQHIWDRSLPDCIEEEALAGSGIVSGLNFDTFKIPPQSATSAKMGHAEADTVFDIVIPTILIVGLFAVNAVIFVIIMKHRKRSNNQLDAEAKELAEL